MMGFRKCVWCTIAAAVWLLAPGRSHGFIDVHRPETLGSFCVRAQSITVLKLDRISKDKGVFVFTKVEDLKGELGSDEIRDALGDAHTDDEKKHTRDAAKVGQTAVVFRYENRLAICLGDHWHVTDIAPHKDRREPWAGATRTEPAYLQSYCGDAEKLAGAVALILDGKEAVVPVMLGGRDKELRKRTGELIRVRSGLKTKDFDRARDEVKAEPKK